MSKAHDAQSAFVNSEVRAALTLATFSLKKLSLFLRSKELRCAQMKRSGYKALKVQIAQNSPLTGDKVIPSKPLCHHSIS